MTHSPPTSKKPSAKLPMRGRTRATEINTEKNNDVSSPTSPHFTSSNTDTCPRDTTHSSTTICTPKRHISQHQTRPSTLRPATVNPISFLIPPTVLPGPHQFDGGASAYETGPLHSVEQHLSVEVPISSDKPSTSTRTAPARQ
jgi:hypothetical protein